MPLKKRSSSSAFATMVDGGRGGGVIAIGTRPAPPVASPRAVATRLATRPRDTGAPRSATIETTSSRVCPAPSSAIISARAPVASVTPARRLKIGSSTAPVVPLSSAPASSDLGRAVVRPRPRKRMRSVSHASSRCAADAPQRVDHPQRLVVRRAQPAHREQRLLRLAPLRLHEELRERRMRRVRDERVEHELRVRRHVEPSLAPAQVLDREPPLLCRRIRTSVTSSVVRMPSCSRTSVTIPSLRDGLVRIACVTHGLRAGGPVLAALEVADVQHERVGLARAVGPAPRDRERAEVRAARAVVRDREMIAIVRELDARARPCAAVSFIASGRKVRLIVAGSWRTTTSPFGDGVTWRPSTLRASRSGYRRASERRCRPAACASSRRDARRASRRVARMSKSIGPYGVPSARTFTPGASRTHFSAIPAPTTSALSDARSYANMSSTERM